MSYLSTLESAILKADNEGICDAARDGYLFDLELEGDTEWVRTVTSLREAYGAMDDLIERRREEYGLGQG